MAITTLGAIALGAATVGSAAISSGASKKASQAATQAADTSAQVQREQLQAAQNALSPYNQAGIPATNAINALLGLTPSMPAQSYGNPQANFQPAQGYQQQPNALSQFVPGHSVEDYSYLAANAMGDMSSNGGGWTMPGTVTGYGGGTFNPDGTQVTTSTNGVPSGPQSAFDNYRNSTGYQFRLNQGMNAINSGWAGKGLLQSGAALKSLNDYGQGMASAEFGNYLGALGNQQALGMSAGSALAGVGQNYANSLSQIYSNKADAIGNAALLNAKNTTNMLGGLSSGIMKYGL